MSEQDEQAQNLYRKSLKLRAEMSDKDGVASCFDGLAAIDCRRGRHSSGIRLWEVAKALRRTVGGIVQPRSQRVYRLQYELLEPYLYNESEHREGGAAIDWEEVCWQIENETN